jgi:hypothetical protein
MQPVNCFKKTQKKSYLKIRHRTYECSGSGSYYIDFQLTSKSLLHGDEFGFLPPVACTAPFFCQTTKLQHMETFRYSKHSRYIEMNEAVRAYPMFYKRRVQNIFSNL